MKSIPIIMITMMAALAPIAGAQPETAKVGTDDAFAVDPGATEIAFGYSLLRTTQRYERFGIATASRDRCDSQVTGMAITRGLRDGLDLGFSVAWADIIDRESEPVSGSGFGDVSLGFKWTLWQDDRLAFAWAGDATVPVGKVSDAVELGPGDGFWSIEQMFAITWIGPHLTATTDVGYRLPFGDSIVDQMGFFAANAAVGWQLRSWLQPEVEINLGHDLIRRSEDSQLAGVTVGFIINASDMLRVDAGAFTGVAGRNADRATGAVVNVSLTM